MTDKQTTRPIIMHPTKVKIDTADRLIRGFTYLFVSIFAVACIIPFWMIIASSFSTEAAIRRTGFTLWPTDFSTYSY
ncbi:MAG: carbohydrate ABC transporter permease, partial [Eubacteriales bacterium]|nr:carbohydrate ABC transporter permease [Eubacteriales bacterium]